MARHEPLPRAARVETRIRESDMSECILWTRCYRNGYGAVRVGKKVMDAHRRAYELAYGPIPEGMWVLHKCDNKGCVNPERLELGTPKKNTQDALARGLIPTGERVKRHKLTSEQVRIIRECVASGASLARRFGVSPQLVSDIRKGDARKSG